MRNPIKILWKRIKLWYKWRGWNSYYEIKADDVRKESPEDITISPTGVSEEFWEESEDKS